MKKQLRLSGQTLIEFVFVLPILLLLVIGLFDFGRAVIYFAVLNTAVREGTRTAIVQNYEKYYGDYPAATIDLSVQAPCDVSPDANKIHANEIICTEVISKYFNIGELYNSILTITPLDIGTDDPKINLKITFLYEPITPLIAPLVGDIPINVESEMLLTPNAIE